MLPIVSNSEILTMSSREIAGYTNKQHQHVKRDIEKMFKELELDTSKVGHIYFDSMNRKQVEYLLDRDQTDCLLTGYSAKARMKVIKRWKELETKLQPQLPQTKREWIEFALEQEKKLELAAPKIAFVDNLVDKPGLMNSTTIAQKHGKSAKWLNSILMNHDVYNKVTKRKTFRQWFVDKKLGEMKKTSNGFSQAKFTNAGEVWINELLIAHGYV